MPQEKVNGEDKVFLLGDQHDGVRKLRAILEEWGYFASTRSAGVDDIHRGELTTVRRGPDQDRIHVIDDRVPEVRTYSLAGALIRTIRWDSPPLEQRIGESVRRFGGTLRLGELGSFVDLRGRLWVEEAPESPGSDRQWLVFTRGGALDGKFRVRPDLLLADVSSGRALFYRFGSNGEEYVELYFLAPMVPPER